jgi:hypothetical protein
MAIIASHELTSHVPGSLAEPLAVPDSERRMCAVLHAIGIGRTIDRRAAVPDCWIVHPVFIVLGVVLLIVVMTDIAIMVVAIA